MPEAVSVAAYVLHTRPYRETSMLVHLFCAELGRFTVVAKGARTKRSSLKGLLQPGVPLLISYAGRGDLKQLHSAEAQGLAFPLVGAYLYSSMYLNELLYYLLEEYNPYPQLFELYQQSLLSLARQQALEPTLRVFELGLLRELGFGLSYPETVAEQLHYVFSLEQGFIPCSAQLSNALRGDQLGHIIEFNPEMSQHLSLAKRFCRDVIQQLLKGKQLRSRALFSSLPQT